MTLERVLNIISGFQRVEVTSYECLDIKDFEDYPNLMEDFPRDICKAYGVKHLSDIEVVEMWARSNGSICLEVRRAV